MNTLTTHTLSKGELWLLITTLLYFLMNGAQIFETFVIIPKWTAAPPESLQLFKGPHALDFKTFWISMHSIHEITFILAIIFCWKTDVRNGLLILFGIHFAVRVWTLAYFAPNIIEFQQIANSGRATSDLISRTAQWRNLNYLRVALFVLVSLGLIPLCMRALNSKL